VAEVDLGSAECRVTGEKEVLEDWTGEAMGNAPEPDSVLGPTGEESQGAVADDVAGGGCGCGGLLQAWDDAPDDGLAVVSRGRGVDDAKSSNVSKAAGVTVVKSKRRCSQRCGRSGQGIKEE
jgi:hypothetical protein